MIWLAPFVALWRWWIGRGYGGWPVFLRETDATYIAPENPLGYRMFPAATYVQYLIELGGVYSIGVYVVHQDWRIALTNAVGLLVYARIYRHGQILSGPGEPDPGGTDYIWNIAKLIPNDEAKWWAYALLRYATVAAMWAGALQAQGHQAGWLLVPAAVLMIAVYRLAWAARNFLQRMAPRFYDYGGHVQYAEFFGWAFVGAALGLV